MRRLRTPGSSIRDRGRFAATLLCLLAAGSAHAAPGDRLVLQIRGPAVPYALAEYSLEAREDAVVVSVTKTFAGEFGHHSTIGLLPQSALADPLTRVDALAAGLGDRGLASARARYQLEWSWGGRTGRLRFGDPETLEERRYQALVALVIEATREAVEPLPFKDALLRPDEYGRLRIASDPPGRVRIDGIAIPGRTPHEGLRVEAGDHRVAVTPIGGGPAFEYDVKVRVGRTTSLVVELK